MRNRDEEYKEPISSREARTYQEYYELKAEEERLRRQRNTAIAISCIVILAAIVIIFLTH